MMFGVSLGGIPADQLAAVAVHSESRNIESVWLPEHIVIPTGMDSTYPYATRAANLGAAMAHAPLLDVFGALNFLAARTERVRLGTAVALLGLRDPFVAARSIVTLDVLSRGRARIGIGAGWLREEYEVMNVDWDQRGARLNEVIDAVSVLFSDPEPRYEGRQISFPPVGFQPKPVQRPRPPIIGGGNTIAAIRRAAHRCDGWMGIGLSPGDTAAVVHRLRELRDGAGRTGPFEISLRVDEKLDVATASAYETAGVDRIIIRPTTPTAALAEIDELASLAEALQ